jgi:hypothetical protein
MGLRAEIEQDLAETLEDADDFGLPVVLISPDGIVYSKSANDEEADLMGQIIYDTVAQDADGNQIIDHKPVVSLRRSSLTRIPLPGEVWAVKIPTSPVADAEPETFMLERAAEDGSSIGFIRLYLRKAEQA